VEFQVLTAASMRTITFRDIALGILIRVDAHFLVVTGLQGCNVVSNMRQRHGRPCCITCCIQVAVASLWYRLFKVHSSHISLAVLLLRLSGLGCPFEVHSSHISLAVLLLRVSGLGCPFEVHSSHTSLACCCCVSLV
jgi:hypothetical protein